MDRRSTILPSSALPSAAALVVCLAAIPIPTHAQVRPSQHGTVSQTVGTTVITIEYDRPVARGRVLWGEDGLVDYGVVWTPGANRATWIDFTAPVTLEGHPVPAGRYGIWTVLREDGPWDVILVSEWDTHHSFFSFETEILRVPVTPRDGGHMETLAWYFPRVEGYEATLAMHWGTRVLPLRIVTGG